MDGAFVHRCLFTESMPNRIGIRGEVAAVPSLNVIGQVEELANPIKVQELRRAGHLATYPPSMGRRMPVTLDD